MFLCINPKAVPRRAEQEAQARAFCVLAGRGEHSLDYFWVLMFVRIIHLALSFCVILAASVEGLVVYGVILVSRTMDVLLTFLQKSNIIFACDY